MSKKDKLLAKAINNPGGLKFSDFEALLGYLGWVFDRQNGSHRIWISPAGVRLPVQNRGGEV